MPLDWVWECTKSAPLVLYSLALRTPIDVEIALGLWIASRSVSILNPTAILMAIGARKGQRAPPVLYRLVLYPLALSYTDCPWDCMGISDCIVIA